MSLIVKWLINSICRPMFVSWLRNHDNPTVVYKFKATIGYVTFVPIG